MSHRISNLGHSRFMYPYQNRKNDGDRRSLKSFSLMFPLQLATAMHLQSEALQTDININHIEHTLTQWTDLTNTKNSHSNNNELKNSRFIFSSLCQEIDGRMQLIHQQEEQSLQRFKMASCRARRRKCKCRN